MDLRDPTTRTTDLLDEEIADLRRPVWPVLTGARLSRVLSTAARPMVDSWAAPEVGNRDHRHRSAPRRDRRYRPARLPRRLDGTTRDARPSDCRSSRLAGGRSSSTTQSVAQLRGLGHRTRRRRGRRRGSTSRPTPALAPALAARPRLPSRGIRQPPSHPAPRPMPPAQVARSYRSGPPNESRRRPPWRCTAACIPRRNARVTSTPLAPEAAGRASRSRVVGRGVRCGCRRARDLEDGAGTGAEAVG